MTTNEKLFLSSGCTKCCSSKDRPKRPTGYPEVSYSLFTLGTRDAGDHNGSRERERTKHTFTTPQARKEDSNKKFCPVKAASL